MLAFLFWDSYRNHLIPCDTAQSAEWIFRFCVLVCKIIRMKSADIIKQLKADGWFLVHVVGSHHQFKHPTKPGKVTVPHPKKDLPLPTVRSILKQAGL